MKKISLTSVALVVGSLMVLELGSGVVLGQDGGTVVSCRLSVVGGDQDIRRVPRAEVSKDESGGSVYKINANDAWRRTDVEVKRGQRIEVSASGTIRWAQDGAAWTIVTADGTRPPRVAHFPFPDAGIGSLVMRIGKGVYPAGTSVVIEAEDDGFVEFMVNDDILTDNSGAFLVKVTIAV
ncbi:hypothetical protein BH10ACI2_BH10ACI2_03710 [soil metagenome]